MTTARGTIRRGLRPHGPCDWELLSGYADGELDRQLRRRVEDHLEGCPSCRADLDSLRRVTSRLGHLERQAPPPVLAERVDRRVEMAARRAGFLARVEQALRRLPVGSSTLLTFGVVVALAAIAALFVSGVEDTGRVLRRGAEMVDDGGGELRVTRALVGERTFDRDGAVWREQGLGAPGEALVEGVVRTVPADAPEARALFEAEPRLRELLAGSEGIVLRKANGEVLQIRSGSEY